MTSELEAALLGLLKAGQGITLNLILTPSDKVQEQEQRIVSMQAEIKRIERELFDTHRRYREAVILNERLFQWLIDNGYQIPEQDTHRSRTYFEQIDPGTWK